jgi:2-polyprenyl-3-methyl-5-hydroxy-6-metoxy-1,4-benzoquinol methylase
LLAVTGEDPLSIQADLSRRTKKTLAERLDIRVLFQRLIGVRQAVKLAKRLDALQYGPLPFQELPQIVNASRARLAAITDNLEEQARDIAALHLLIEAMDKRVAEIVEKAALIRECVNIENSDALYVGSQNVTRDAFADIAIDALYAKLDERFRNSRQDTPVHRNVYLPAIKAAVFLTNSTKILDAGCHQGDFLELLRADGIDCIGIDANSSMVNNCKNRGFNVFKADTCEYIRQLPENSFAAICAFHMLDRLPFKKMINFIDCARLALAPGGILLIENQNPANFFVAEEKFYVDPTRGTSFSSEMMSFIVESCGFTDLTVVQPHSVSEARREYDDPMLTLLQDKIYGAQAYGIIARKPF